jgi:hypothetical protein
MIEPRQWQLFAIKRSIKYCKKVHLNPRFTLPFMQKRTFTGVKVLLLCSIPIHHPVAYSQSGDVVALLVEAGLDSHH